MSTAHISPATYRKRAAKHVPECDTQSAILQWLAIMHVRAVRIESAGQPIYGARPAGRKMPQVVGMKVCAHVGTPDILAFLPWGQACAIEVKRAGEGRTGLRFSQARWIIETAKLSPLTMILIAESMLDVEEVLKPMLDDWRDGLGVSLSSGEPWQLATASALATAKQRIARGPQ